MKRKLQGLLAALLAVGLAAAQPPVRAAEAGAVHVTAERTGDHLVLSVTAAELEFNALQLTLQYDTARLEPSDIETNEAVDDVDAMSDYQAEYNRFTKTGWASVRPVLNPSLGMVEYTLSLAAGAKEHVNAAQFVESGDSMALLRLSFRVKPGQTLYRDSIVCGATDANPTGIAIAARNPEAKEGDDPILALTDASLVKIALGSAAEPTDTPSPQGGGASGGTSGGATGGTTGGASGGGKPETLPSIEPAPETRPEIRLTDISGHWAENAIRYLVSQGVLNGDPDGAFRPDGSITRAEFATIVARAYRLPASDGTAFSDVRGHWAEAAVASAQAAGLLSGEGNGLFAPERAISRQELVTVLLRAEKAPVVSADERFADDARIAPWARDAVYTMRAADVVQGYEDGTFRPEQPVTRGEAASLLTRLMM